VEGAAGDLTPMWRTRVRYAALVGTALALGACNDRPPEHANPAGSSAPPPTPKVIATAPFTLPAGARTVPEPQARKANATALGPSITLQFANTLGEEDDGYRRVDESLVLVGSGALIVEIGDDPDDAAAHAGAATGTLYAEPPLSPPRPFRAADATVAKNMLPFQGPLLFLRQGKGGEVAVAHVGDTIRVWRLMILHGEAEEGTVQDWFEHAKIQLAPGAVVVAK